MTAERSKIKEHQNSSLPNINLWGRNSKIHVSLNSDPTLPTKDVPQMTMEIDKPPTESKDAVPEETQNESLLESSDPPTAHFQDNLTHEDAGPLESTNFTEGSGISQHVDFGLNSAASEDPEDWQPRQDQEAWSTPRSRSAESLFAPQTSSKLRICNILSRDTSRMHFSISEQSFPGSIQLSPLKTSPHSSTAGFSILFQDDLSQLLNGSEKLASSEHQKYLSFANFDPSFKLSEEILEGSGDFVPKPSIIATQDNLHDRLGSFSSFESADDLLLSNIYRRLTTSLQSAIVVGKTTKINSVFDVPGHGGNKGLVESKLASSDSVPLSKAVKSLEKERITSLRTNLKNRDPNKETALWSDHSANHMDAFGDSPHQNSGNKSTNLCPKSRRHKFNNRSSWTTDRLIIHNEFVLRSHLYLSVMLLKRALAKKISTVKHSVNAGNQFPSSNTLGLIHRSVQTSGCYQIELTQTAVQNNSAICKAETKKSQRTKVEISQHSIYDRRSNEVRCRVVNKRLRYSSYNTLKRTKMIEGAIRSSVSQLVKNTKIDQAYGFHKDPNCRALSISHRFQSGGKKNQIVVKYETKKYTVYNEPKKKTAWSILGKKATHMLSLVYPINVDPQQILELRRRGVRSRVSGI